MRSKLWIALAILLLSLPVLAVEYDPKLQKAMLHFKEGFKAFNRAEYPKALENYKNALDQKPNATQIWYEIGRTYYKLGLMDHAILSWKRFLELSGDIPKELGRKIKTLFAQEYRRESIMPSVYKYLDTITGTKWDMGRFYSPTSITIDDKENIYLVDAGAPAIIKFSTTGDFLARFGKNELKRPMGIALDKEGNIYVSDFGEDSVKKFDPMGKMVLKIGRRGNGDGEFIGPEGITLDGHGNIYVVDTGNTRIQKFDKDGNFLMKFGKTGHYAGCFAHPVDVLLDENGDIWVTDAANGHLQRFDPSGNFLAEFKPPAEGVELRGMIEEKGRAIFVSDAKGRIFRFEYGLNQWQALDLAGKDPGVPVDVAIGENGLLYLSDFKNRAIEVFVPSEQFQTDFDVMVDRVITDHYPTIAYCVSVTGRDRLPVLGLTERNFRIFEKGRLVSPIAVKTPLQDKEHLTAIFIVDTSKEMAPYKNEVKKILFGFIEKMKPGVQAGAVISFDNTVYQPQSPTRNKNRLTYAIGLLTYNKGSRAEAMPKAIYKGVTDTLNLYGKRVIILLTRGQKEGVSSSLMKEVLYYTRNNHLQTVVIDFHEGEKVDEGLARFTELTDGVYLLAHRSPLELDNLYEEVTHLVKRQNQYFLFYESPTTEFSGKWVDGLVSAGYGRFYGEDLGGYFVP